MLGKRRRSKTTTYSLEPIENVVGARRNGHVGEESD
jgi:hypothetical protein